ncbi:DNA-binding protein, histone-like, putative [Draconibacterium orientale]|uniref:Viral histone-like protein n=1 Tax=Draconibacterium orientale TaxID=1168034 RepID=X5DX76_9BACT|nr:HU family DNA-binding protein [Draconibacterium orientale]AHW58861.1 DNA-binding protein [Draconibacterium orientale]SET93260.1 DNA-binding protein, histone-like, putative [Draconibacterium orientale]
MLKYKLIEKANPRDLTAPKKFYASHVSSGRKTISRDIEDKSSLSRGDISNVLDNLVDQIPKYLLDGQTVSLGDLGSFRLTLSSEGAEQEKNFKSNMIKNVKIIFTPGKMLKEEVAKARFDKSE